MVAGSITVRDASTDDVPGILAIYNDVIATSTAVYREDPASLDDRLQWFNAFESLPKKGVLFIFSPQRRFYLRSEGQILRGAFVGQTPFYCLVRFCMKFAMLLCQCQIE